MSTIEELQEKYQSLGRRSDIRSEDAVDSGCLLAFEYEYRGQDAEIEIDTQEFTAVCPWSGLPDLGTLTVSYVPDSVCLELKSLRYYLLSYSGVGIVQEHAANRILKDLARVCQPLRMTVALDYNVRGGLHSRVTVRYQRP